MTQIVFKLKRLKTLALLDLQHMRCGIIFIIILSGPRLPCVLDLYAILCQ